MGQTNCACCDSQLVVWRLNSQRLRGIPQYERLFGLIKWFGLVKPFILHWHLGICDLWVFYLHILTPPLYCDNSATLFSVSEGLQAFCTASSFSSLNCHKEVLSWLGCFCDVNFLEKTYSKRTGLLGHFKVAENDTHHFYQHLAVFSLCRTGITYHTISSRLMSEYSNTQPSLKLTTPALFFSFLFFFVCVFLKATASWVDNFACGKDRAAEDQVQLYFW